MFVAGEYRGVRGILLRLWRRGVPEAVSSSGRVEHPDKEDRMRKTAIIVLVSLVAASQVLFAFDSSELNKVTFVNATTVAIKGIFFSPGDSNEWGPDMLGSDRTLAPKAQLAFFVHYPESTAKFDIMAVDDKDRALIIYDYVFKDGKEETIQFRAKDMAKSMPDVSFIELTLENSLDVEVDYLFCSPADSSAWGADILDETSVLASGESKTIMIPVAKEKVDYNVMAVDVDNGVYKFDVSMDPNSSDTFHAAIEASDKE
jgi:hypothetical protein